MVEEVEEDLDNMKKKGIGNKLIRVIRSTYHSTKRIVRIDGMKSEEFEMRNGVN